MMRCILSVALLVPAAAFAASVSINPAAPGPVLTNQIIGANMANWYDQTQSGLAQALKSAGFHAVRWPGGSASDLFHWQQNFECEGGYVSPNSTFDNFVNDVVKPASLDLAVTVNYGSNTACNGPGDPAEAASWVTYAKQQGYTVSHWTVGNEVYGSWEYDLHNPPNNAATYANAVATGYYPQMKAANSKALVGVVVDPGWSPAWDPTVLAQAKYDFVEYHFYAQTPGQESDTYLLTQAPQALTTQLQALQAELKTAGHASTPIYVGELGSVYANPGKQSTSITQALFAGEILGEMINAGVARATWWLGFGGCSDASSGANFSSSLYGWQSFGGYMMFSDGLPEYGCSNAPTLARGTDLPTARAFALMSLVAIKGEHQLPAATTGSADLRAYGMTHSGGTAAVLFNLNETASLPITLAVTGVSSSSSVTLDVYDKAIYDKSQKNVWAGSSHTNMGAQSLPLTLSLAPWSMTVVRMAK